MPRSKSYNKWNWPSLLNLLEHFDIQILKKSKTEMDITHFHA